MDASEIDKLIAEAEEHDKEAVDVGSYVIVARRSWPACARALQEMRDQRDRLRGAIETQLYPDIERLRAENERLAAELREVAP